MFKKVFVFLPIFITFLFCTSVNAFAYGEKTPQYGHPIHYKVYLCSSYDIGDDGVTLSCETVSPSVGAFFEDIVKNPSGYMTYCRTRKTSPDYWFKSTGFAYSDLFFLRSSNMTLSYNSTYMIPSLSAVYFQYNFGEVVLIDASARSILAVCTSPVGSDNLNTANSSNPLYPYGIISQLSNTSQKNDSNLSGFFIDDVTFEFITNLDDLGMGGTETTPPVTNPPPPATYNPDFVPWDPNVLKSYDSNIKNSVGMAVNVGFVIFAMIIAVYVVIRIVKKFSR